MYSQILDPTRSEGQSHPVSQCLSRLIEKIGDCGGSSSQGRSTGPLTPCLACGRPGVHQHPGGSGSSGPCWWDRRGGLQGGDCKLTLTDADPWEGFVRGASRAA